MILMTFVAVLGQTSNTFAAENQPNRCGDLNNTHDIEMCLGRETEEADRQLSLYNDAALKSVERLDPAVKSHVNLKATTDAFELYRKTECGNAGGVFFGGSVGTMQSQQCYMQVTRERTYRIWRDFIAIPAMGPPSLPDPS